MKKNVTQNQYLLKLQKGSTEHREIEKEKLFLI